MQESVYIVVRETGWYYLEFQIEERQRPGCLDDLIQIDVRVDAELERAHQ
jgi:hypothetical protein